MGMRLATKLQRCYAELSLLTTYSVQCAEQELEQLMAARVQSSTYARKAIRWLALSVNFDPRHSMTVTANLIGVPLN